jgi:DNA-binding transcriptional regulator PaaX
MSTSNTASLHIQLPSEETIIATAKYLLDKPPSDRKESKYAPVRELLCRIGAGESIEAGALSQFNPYYIKRTLGRLMDQGFVEKGDEGYQLTVRGKRWLLKYTLDDLSIPKPAKWDGRWRMIIYDVARNRASQRTIFRSTLKNLGFYNVQESVWIHPYPCEKEIHFLKDFCGMGDNVIYIIAHKIENDGSYRTHFGL